jgi:hypothetical protein
MNCEEFWNGEPHGLDHLRECAGCAARFERHEQLASALHRLGAHSRRLQAPARVERQLVAGFRGRAEFGRLPKRAGLWWTVGAWAAGLAATVGIAIFLAGGRQPERTERIGHHATQLAAVEISGQPQAVDGNEFIPLPNVESIAANEPMNLVRIEAPRSAMIALGLEVDPDRAEETVEAEVMLGADGIARAVRFLE